MKKFRHLWLSILTLILSVSIIIGGAGIAAFASPTGLPFGGDSDPTTVTLPSSVELGDEVNVDLDSSEKVSVSVKAPNGASVTLKDKKFTADMLGNYEIEYGSKDVKNAKYTHIVNVKLSSDFELRVVGDGASIPTYTYPDKPHTLPDAVLYERKKGEDEYKALPNNEYGFDLKIYIDNGSEAIDKSVEQKFGAGRHTVQYVAQLKKGDKLLNKYFTKKYEVNSQDGFTDNTRPTISISGVPTDASLNTKVTLPKATATDNFDKNVQVIVSVKLNNKEVCTVDTDQYGYADKETLTETPVKFDNVYTMSFYPTEEGTYVVEYYAKDDMGNESVKQPFNIRVQDRTAPKLEEIDDDKIPAAWGLNVVNEGGSVSDTTITFPFPTYSDNSGKDNISVSFEIRDTVNNTSVIKFDNIYDQEGNGSKYTISDNSTYKVSGQESVKFDEAEGFKFDFKNYTVKKDGSDEKETPKGVYTVIYNARDKKPNSTTKSYDIDLQDTFTDKVAPSVDMDADKYLYIDDSQGAKETEYTLPTATISDATDTRPTVVYKLIPGIKSGETFQKASDFEYSFVVENGSDIKIKVSSGKVSIMDANGKLLPLMNADGDIIENDEDEPKTFSTSNNVLQLNVTATDDVGNGANKPFTADVALVFASDFASLEFTEGNLEDKIETADFQTYDQANLKGFQIENIDAAHRNYVGFEIYISDPKGDIIPDIDLQTYYDPKTETLNVEDITFTPSVATKESERYTLTVRIFDITGRSVVLSYEFEVGENENAGDVDKISAAPIPSSGKINVSYKIKNEEFYATNVADGRKYIVRKISNAGRFSLMGTEFTAYTAGTVTFEDSYYTKVKEGDPKLTPIGAAYYFTADDNSTPVFELLGKAPVQWKDKAETAEDKADKENKWVKFPEIVAYNEYANAKISVNVTNPNGRTYKWIEDMDHDNVEDYIDFTDGVLSFLPELDGEYTVEFVASVGSSDEARATYTVRVGDTVPPTFSLSTGYSTTARQNGKFEFKKMILSDGDKGDIANITFTKRLLDPSGNEVYSVSGKDDTYANKQVDSSGEKYTFTMTGRYRVEYTATDKAGNSSVYQDEINVSATESTGAAPLKILRTVLIIVGVILIAGVILYFVRFRKVKAE